VSVYKASCFHLQKNDLAYYWCYITQSAGHCVRLIIFSCCYVCAEIISQCGSISDIDQNCSMSMRTKCHACIYKCTTWPLHGAIALSRQCITAMRSVGSILCILSISWPIMHAQKWFLEVAYQYGFKSLCTKLTDCMYKITTISFLAPWCSVGSKLRTLSFSWPLRMRRSYISRWFFIRNLSVLLQESM